MMVKRLVWDEWNIEHIARHRVSPREAEEVCRDNKYIVRESYRDRLMLIGPTLTERILVVVVAPKPNGGHYVVTARPADRKECRLYQLEKGGGLK